MSLGASRPRICQISVELVLAYARTGTRRTKRRPDAFGDLIDQLKALEQLVDALHVVEMIVRSPEALANLLEGAGALALERAGAILEERFPEE